MFDTVVRRGAIVDRSILDKEVVVGQGAIVGDGGDDTPNKREPSRLNTGISVVGKRSVIPRGARIGRNVRIGGDVRATDYRSRVVPSGGSIDRSARALSAIDRDSAADEPREAAAGGRSGDGGGRQARD
jgi:glucose-1-phosphate adenylyltransferase